MKHSYLFVVELVQGLKKLLTAAEILDQSEPNDQDDIEYFLEQCENARRLIALAEDGGK